MLTHRVQTRLFPSFSWIIHVIFRSIPLYFRKGNFTGCVNAYVCIYHKQHDFITWSLILLSHLLYWEEWIFIKTKNFYELVQGQWAYARLVVSFRQRNNRCHEIHVTRELTFSNATYSIYRLWHWKGFKVLSVWIWKHSPRYSFSYICTCTCLKR